MNVHLKAFIATLLMALVFRAPVLRGQEAPSVPRAAHALARGIALTAGDIAVDSGAVVPDALIGLVTRRMMRAGEPLRAPAIGKPVIVHAGTAVLVATTFGAITISRPGVALFDAGLGDSVRVRIDARTQMIGVAKDSSTVMIGR
ncbi:MAG TPA: flagellar basal body P-ring formation chaperone FlgA [Gemmatimonadaceae bacterium]|nr:flagellar basal body P-ring formation chaperone FlgA [Gemmatimonadaceae bacterium]